MSDRERWIVYPLICFAFLLGARDKYVQPQQAEFRTVRCQELQIVSDSGKSLINLYGSLEDAGVIVVYSHGSGGEPGDVPQLDPLAGQATLGSPVLELGADGHLGFVKVYGRDAQFDLKLGHERANAVSGLYALDSEDQLVDEGPPARAGTWGLLRPWEKPADPPPAVEEGPEPASADSVSGSPEIGESPVEPESG